MCESNVERVTYMKFKSVLINVILPGKFNCLPIVLAHPYICLYHYIISGRIPYLSRISFNLSINLYCGLYSLAHLSIRTIAIAMLIKADFRNVCNFDMVIYLISEKHYPVLCYVVA